VRIFLSYRRGDVGGYAGRLTDALIQRLGSKNVFHDVTAIAPGQDYAVAIDRALDGCDAVLTVIGPGWLTAPTPDGARRLLDTDDYVRLELAGELSRDIRVIPVLVGGAPLPAAADLPKDLQGLTLRQAVALHDETWHQDVDGLVRSLRGEPTVPGKRGRRWLAVGTAIVALLAVGAVAWWRWGPGTGAEAGSNPAIAACALPQSNGWSPIALGKNPTATEKQPDGSLIFKVKGAYWRADGGKWQVILATSMQNATPQTVYHADWRYQDLVVADRGFSPTCFSGDSDTVDPELTGDARVGFEVRCKPVGLIKLRLESSQLSVTPDTLQPRAC
jgi:hypothetical protein